MRKFIAGPNTKVNGYNVLSVTQNLKADEIQPLLEKYQLGTIVPEQWYPFQLVLDIFREIADGRFNSVENLVAIGMKAAELSLLGTEALSFEDVLKDLNAAYRLNFQNLRPGEGWLVEVLGNGHVQVTPNVATPDDIAFGLFWGFARRLLPPGTKFLIKPLKYLPPDSEKSAVFDITWGNGFVKPLPEVKTDDKKFIALQTVSDPASPTS